MHRWVRLTANMSLGAYESFEASANIPEPTWPDLPFAELLKIAFRDRLVIGPTIPSSCSCAARSDARTLPFREVWAVDFEFAVKDGARPDPVCLVAWELRSGRRLKLWRSEFGPSPPYSDGPDSLFIAYYASAEIGCHLALGWPKPARILDLFTEFRCGRMAYRRPRGPAFLARSPITASTAWPHQKRTPCEI